MKTAWNSMKQHEMLECTSGRRRRASTARIGDVFPFSDQDSIAQARVDTGITLIVIGPTTATTTATVQ
jgi:hypothetical protein